LAVPTTLTTIDHGSNHIWTGASPRTVRCAEMICDARPSRIDVERLRAEIEAARRMRTAIEFRPPKPAAG
jgi:hypothetical protein